MLNMSKTTNYALKGMYHLVKNRHSGMIKIDRIADEEGIPLNYLRKIFQQLIRQKILSSGVGPHGGVQINEEKLDISVGDLITIFDGEPDFSNCTLFGHNRCLLGKSCPILSECRSDRKLAWEKLKKFKIKNFKSRGELK